MRLQSAEGDEQIEEIRHNRWMQYGLLSALALLWGSSYMFIRIGLETIPPISLVAFRSIIAVFFLLIVIRLQKEQLPKGADIWRKFYFQSFLSGFGPGLLLAWGERIVASDLASVLNSSSPIFVVIITVLITRHEPIGVRKVTGALCGMGGVFLIIGLDALTSFGQQLFAELAILLSSLLYGFGAINGRKFKHLPPIVTVAGMLICSSSILLPASLIIDQPWTLSPSWRSLAAASALGIIATAGGLILYFHLIKTLGSLGTDSQSYLRMGVGVLLGVLLLEEELPALIGLGLVLIILGVVLINYPKRAEKPLTPKRDSAAPPRQGLPGD